jgi:methylated-DNA-[protein]-cysteine S-methyltransferase
MMEPMYTSIFASPLGNLLLTSNGVALTGLYLDGHRGHPSAGAGSSSDLAVFADAHEQLERYFAGELRSFDLDLEPSGTPFQHRVWEALSDIPFGATVSYADIARQIGQPTASRAVGAANGRNPISIVIPCHRVIGTNGTMTGYGGGVSRKVWLLEHETGVLTQRGTELLATV